MIAVVLPDRGKRCRQRVTCASLKMTRTFVSPTIPIHSAVFNVSADPLRGAEATLASATVSFRGPELSLARFPED